MSSFEDAYSLAWVKGYKVTLRTPYRWASKRRMTFSKLLIINQKELRRWLELANIANAVNCLQRL